MWSDEKDTIVKLLEDSHEKYPRICPCCGKKTGHVFFYKHDENKYGSAWAWCSTCQEYSHSRFETPTWWRNNASFPLEILHGCPDTLDESCDEIDNWANILLDEDNKIQ
ncbi:MAG: hypothetical protein J5778_01105 [Clostridiales bacterium]|nr:hypothetical protein [Clostridiales bacterium]